MGSLAHRVFASGSLARHSPPGRLEKLPPITFWAWERPEDMRYVSPDQAAIAFLAKTIYLHSPSADGVTGSSAIFTVRPRLQPLRVPHGVPLIAVIRIESGPEPRSAPAQQFISPLHDFSYSGAQRALLAEEVAALQSLPGISAVQIDFDAPASAHAFYAALLQDVRAKLSPFLPLSITALASWCIGDRWLDQLPPATIDEAVPMLFRMGPDAANVANFLHSNGNFPVAACRGSLGLSTDESLSRDLLTPEYSATFDARQNRIYIFAPHAWTPSDAEKILKEWQP